MENMPRDFKGVWIPKEIWLDKRLNALDKIILTEIDSLDQGEEGCWASNQYIAEFCQCSSTKVSTSISKLIEYGYLYVKSFDGRCRVLKSRLSNFERQDLKKCKADFKNLKEINIKNNTSNNIKKNKYIHYGEYQNVFFTEEQYEKLKNEFPTDYTNRIDKLDLYMQSTGKKYKDCLATIRNWSRNENKQMKGKVENGKFEKSNGSEFAEFV